MLGYARNGVERNIAAGALLNEINHDPHLLLTRTLFLHLSCLTPLGRTLTVDHYLCIDYFQHF